MSTWTSDAARRGLLVAGLALVAGCGGGFGTFGRAADGPPTRIAVAGGAVTVQGPRGYCIDTAGSSLAQPVAVVVLAACDALAGSDRVEGPAHRAILTATVMAMPAGEAVPASDTLADFFATEAGRAALSRSGEAADVEILLTELESQALTLRLRDTGLYDGPPVEDSYWRTIRPIAGHLVTVSVLVPLAVPMEPAAERELLDDFVEQMRRSNGAFVL